MFYRTDAFLLTQMQKVCNKFTELTGRTKYRLQKWTLIVGFLVWLANAILVFDPELVMLGFFFFTTVVLATYITEEHEAEFLAKNNIQSSLFSFSLERIIATIICVVMFGLMAVSGNFQMCLVVIIFFIWIYTTACLPWPPSKSKVRQMYEKSLAWLNDKLSPVLEPVPSK